MGAGEPGGGGLEDLDLVAVIAYLQEQVDALVDVQMAVLGRADEHSARIRNLQAAVAAVRDELTGRVRDLEAAVDALRARYAQREAGVADQRVGGG